MKRRFKTVKLLLIALFTMLCTAVVQADTYVVVRNLTSTNQTVTANFLWGGGTLPINLVTVMPGNTTVTNVSTNNMLTQDYTVTEVPAGTYTTVGVTVPNSGTGFPPPGYVSTSYTFNYAAVVPDVYLYITFQ